MPSTGLNGRAAYLFEDHDGQAVGDVAEAHRLVLQRPPEALDEHVVQAAPELSPFAISVVAILGKIVMLEDALFH